MSEPINDQDTPEMAALWQSDTWIAATEYLWEEYDLVNNLICDLISIDRREMADELQPLIEPLFDEAERKAALLGIGSGPEVMVPR